MEKEHYISLLWTKSFLKSRTPPHQSQYLTRIKQWIFKAKIPLLAKTCLNFNCTDNRYPYFSALSPLRWMSEVEHRQLHHWLDLAWVQIWRIERHMEKPSKEPSTLAYFFSAVDNKHRTCKKLTEFVFVYRQQYTILFSVLIQQMIRNSNSHPISSWKVSEMIQTSPLPVS